MAAMTRGTSRSWQARLASDDGQDLIEYALTAALIAVVAVGRRDNSGTNDPQRLLAGHCRCPHLVTTWS